MLFPAFIGRTSDAWHPQHNLTQFQSLLQLWELDPSSLELQCHHFLVQGLASSTRSTYLFGQKKFYDFCLQLGKIHQSGSPCPTDEWMLCLFVTFLANTVQHSTIKVYLSAVRSLHIEQGFADPLVDCLHLQRVLRGIKRTQDDTSSLRLPVTDDIMMVIFSCFRLEPSRPLYVLGSM